MASHLALLIEDDPEQIEWIVPKIRQRGFDVIVAVSDTAARDVMADETRDFDLIVVDRRIPHVSGGSPLDVLGDGLRVALKRQYVGARIMVLTAYPDINQVQEVSESSGSIQVRDQEMNRVSLYTKMKLIDFEDAVAKFSNLLNEIDDIEIHLAHDQTLSNRQLRCIRRAAVEFSAVISGASMRAQAL
jgi:response regulator RpfG family c-di-GMP phosphodiesterase